MICFFTPSGVKSLLDNFPNFKQNGTVITAFGSNTSKAVVDAGFKLEIQVPSPQRPSMVAALDQFLASATAVKQDVNPEKAAPKALGKAPSKSAPKIAAKAPRKNAAKKIKL
jgi:uroporphyrinogen-III synthase